MGGTMINSGCRNSRRYRTTRTGKLFFCFNSRFFSSSSSMNISSRSILSPARHHPLSLSASLSRRLRSDGSLKGGQSPMFPTNTASKKRTAGALENPEPTSPKVTCIGQVRVKSKKKNNNNNKHGRKLRNPSRRRSGGDGSFRRTDNWGSVDLSSSQSNILPENRHRNQRWVHLPLTICEGLKGLGAEISCLLPCRSSSCFSSSSSSSERGSKRERSIRSNLEEMEISREKVLEANNKLDTSSDVDEEEERLSVCVPPKNALLLMRCRSDPMRMAALSRRLLESPLSNGDEPEGNNVGFEETQPERCSLEEGNENLEEDLVIDMPEEEAVEEGEEHFDEENSGMDEELEEESEQRKEEPLLEEVEDSQRGSTMEEEEEDIMRDSTMEEEEEDILKVSTMEEEEEEEDILRVSIMKEVEEENEIDAGSLSASGNEDEQKFIEEIGEENKEEELESVGSDSESKLNCEDDLAMESTKEMESVEEEKVENDEEEEEERRLAEMAAPEPLPDCLLLMMCEPKVSMEVSEETWVCSTDFMRFLPERRRPSVESEKKKKVVDRRNTNHPSEFKQAAQPPRSSCSIPGKAAPVLSTVQKLPRCKSEPMRTAAAKLVPSSETCMWKSRKVDPLRRATVGVVGGGSATGVGGASEQPVFVL